MTLSPRTKPSPKATGPVPLYLGLAVVVIAAVALGWWLRVPHRAAPTAVPNGSPLAVEPEGIPLTTTVTIQDKQVEFVKAYRSDGFRRSTAAGDSDFVVVTFKPIAGNAGSLLEAVKGFRLTSGTEEFGRTAIDLPSAEDVSGNGAVVFTVPASAGPKFTLHLTGDTTVPLELAALP